MCLNNLFASLYLNVQHSFQKAGSYCPGSSTCSRSWDFSLLERDESLFRRIRHLLPLLEQANVTTSHANQQGLADQRHFPFHFPHCLFFPSFPFSFALGHISIHSQNQKVFSFLYGSRKVAMQSQIATGAQPSNLGCFAFNLPFDSCLITTPTRQLSGCFIGSS